MTLFAALFVVGFFQISLAKLPQNGTRQCSGTLGMVTDVRIGSSSTAMNVYFSEPIGYEGCGLNYNIHFGSVLNGATYYMSTTNNFYESFNYFDEHVLCKTVSLSIVPVYGSSLGEAFSSSHITVGFDDRIDIGPVRNLRLEITNVLQIRWWTPVDYESCIVGFNVEITDTYSGDLLDSKHVQGYQHKYDFAADKTYCKQVTVSVESSYRSVSGGTVSAQIQLPC